ncbi:hypothetical protein N665_0530s0023 [Sinapis alba]|nr:hypothetical protein N665_0530s0023 [Sinapis alba]
METITEKEYICKFCNKKFPSGKSLGGHIRIHTNKRLFVEQREITALKQQLCCRECGKGFDSLKDLWSHMDCYHCEGEKLIVMDSQSDSSGPTRKRSKKQSSSDCLSNGSSSSSSACEIEQEDKNSALSLMMMSMDSKGLTLVAESSVNYSEILETKVSSGEQLKMIFNQDLQTDKVALVVDDDDLLSDSYSSDSDYFMNGPKKSDSVDRCLRNNDDELESKEGRSKYELLKSKWVDLSSYESDSCADTNRMMIHSKKAITANKNSKCHECPICFRVFKSGQALGGHKRSHSFVNQQHRIKHKAAAYLRIDLNLPAQDI